MCVRARPSARAPPPAVDAHLLHQQDLLHPPHPLHPPSQAAHKATLEDKKALIDKVDCFIFDCDGVIWRGDSVIEGVPETLDMLRAKVGVPGRGGGGVAVRRAARQQQQQAAAAVAAPMQVCSARHSVAPGHSLALAAAPPCTRTPKPPHPHPQHTLTHRSHSCALTGQAACVCDQQLHKVPGRLPGQVHRAGPQRQGGASDGSVCLWVCGCGGGGVAG